MRKSEVTAEQLAFRERVIEKLRALGWSGPREEQAFEADLILDTEVSMVKRNSKCLMEVRYSFEYDYMAFLVAQPAQGNADYIIYHRGLDDSLVIMDHLLEHFNELDFENSIDLFRTICRDRPGDIYFFDGAESLELTPDNIDMVIKGSPINRAL